MYCKGPDWPLPRPLRLDYLDNDVLTFIFSILDIESLNRCRCVSKKWHCFASDIKLIKLVVVNNGHDPSDNWWYDNQFIPSSIIFKNNELNFHKFFNLKNLKRLRISGCLNGNGFSFDTLNLLKNLEHLEILKIDSGPLSHCSNESVIQLQNLKSIYIGSIVNHTIHLKTPKLVAASIDQNFDAIKLIYPLELQILEIDFFRSDILSLKNLISLRLDSMNNLHNDIILKLPSLEELFLSEDLTETNYDHCAHLMIYLLGQQKAIHQFSNRHLKIYFNDVVLQKNCLFKK